MDAFGLLTGMAAATASGRAANDNIADIACHIRADRGGA